MVESAIHSRAERPDPAVSRFISDEGGTISVEYVALAAGILFLVGVLINAIAAVMEGESEGIVEAMNRTGAISAPFGAGGFQPDDPVAVTACNQGNGNGNGQGCINGGGNGNVATGGGNGNNGWGNGDQDAPGNSQPNNNAENGGGPAPPGQGNRNANGPPNGRGNG